ncbi:DeoR/GlpR family DNA-binding transcription regulator [Fundicoccus culcitae]|uniref:DeoR/GlpR family DNA-binding transcription regulator n=1 Tax=Fundicoccus culcitae TaxID=2969821 RepID=A0ABY5P5V5_9LACT|nr:DeoR/GlpR family DNA-binding transcription regulator [Fundicoccus culcitae]UUX33778.1 DeoR/GlpR family DNA-binding transcription regulator [Fundicoccus culcitae]
MLAHERREKILEILNRQQTFRISEHISQFNVTTETLRRDLEELESQNLLTRIHGGAIKVDKYPVNELNFKTRSEINLKAKKEIAKTAMQFVHEHDYIAMDVSTTNTEIAKELVNHFDSLTIITNSIEIISILSVKPNFTIIIPGGILRNKELAIIGESAENEVSQYNIRLFLMSISGISLTASLTDYGIGEVKMKKKFLENSKEVILVADHSKFEAIAFQKVCDFNQIECIVTDSGLDAEVLKVYEANDIKIVTQ